MVSFTRKGSKVRTLERAPSHAPSTCNGFPLPVFVVSAACPGMAPASMLGLARLRSFPGSVTAPALAEDTGRACHDTELRSPQGTQIRPPFALRMGSENRDASESQSSDPRPLQGRHRRVVLETRPLGGDGFRGADRMPPRKKRRTPETAGELTPPAASRMLERHGAAPARRFRSRRRYR